MVDRTFSQTPRLYVSFDFVAGQSHTLHKAQSNYLAAVLRKKDGAEIILFNGRDGAWLAHLTNENKKSLAIEIDKNIAAQTEPTDIIYLFAPLKSSRLDYMVQKATEMGVAALQPVVTQYSQITKLKQERLQANCIEAAEQCEILSVPPLHDPVKLGTLLADWSADWPAGRQLVFCDESAAQQDPLIALAPLKGKPLAVLIGPEGGFSASERDLLINQDFVTAISLGPRIIRADTAAVAALALVQAVCGDTAAQ